MPLIRHRSEKREFIPVGDALKGAPRPGELVTVQFEGGKKKRMEALQWPEAGPETDNA